MKIYRVWIFPRLRKFLPLQLDSIEKKNMVALFLLTGLSVFFCSWPFTLGVILGGIIVIANFKALRAIVEALFKQKQKNFSGIITFFSYFFRFSLLGGMVFLVIYFEITHPIGFLLGLSTVFFGITLEVISVVFKKRRGKVEFFG